MKKNHKPAKIKNQAQKANDANHSRNGHQPKARTASQHKTRIDLPEKDRIELCEMLNQSLADCLDLYSQVKQAHWNVKGVHFYQLHLLFDEIAGEVIEFVDMFAERVTTLGGTAFGTVRMAARNSNLPDYPTDIDEGMQHVVALADRLAIFGRTMRENIDEADELDDKDTADLYTEVSRDIDKRLWFLEAHLQAPTATHEAKGDLFAVRK